MRKTTAILLFCLIFLVACASPVLQPTATAVVVQPTAATATQTPTPRVTITPPTTETALESSDLNLSVGPLWYDKEYIAQFSAIVTEQRNLNGYEVSAVVADGVVIAADMNGDGKMERVSQYTDAEGRAWFTWLNMELGMGPSEAIQLEPGATQILTDRFFLELSKKQFSGLTPEQIKQKMIDSAALGELTTIWTANSPYPMTEDNEWDTAWEQVKCNPALPWEIVNVGSVDQLKALPAEWQEKLGNPAIKEVVGGGILTCGPDGHVILIGVDTTTVGYMNGMDPAGIEKIMDKYGFTINKMRKDGSHFNGINLLFGLNRLDMERDNSAMTKYPQDSEGNGILEAFPKEWWEQ